MITFKCPNCGYSFSEADKAWDKAVAHGGCPKCKTTHSALSFNGKFSPKVQIQPLGVIGHFFAIITTAVLSAGITFLLGQIPPLNKLSGGMMDGLIVKLAVLIIVYIVVFFIAHLYTLKYFRQIKKEGI